MRNVFRSRDWIVRKYLSYGDDLSIGNFRKSSDNATSHDNFRRSVAEVGARYRGLSKIRQYRANQRPNVCLVTFSRSFPPTFDERIIIFLFDCASIFLYFSRDSLLRNKKEKLLISFVQIYHNIWFRLCSVEHYLRKRIEKFNRNIVKL